MCVCVCVCVVVVGGGGGGGGLGGGSLRCISVRICIKNYFPIILL